MKKIYLIIGVCIASILLTNCNNNAPNELAQVITEPNVKEVTVSENSNLGKVAKVISLMGLDLDMVKEIKTNVEGSLKKGYDEEIMFKELLSQDQISTRSVATESNTSRFASRFTECFIQEAPSMGLRSVTSPTDLLEEMEAKGINLYWPYSEDWDGRTMPVIAVSPEDDSQDKCLAYKLKKAENGFILDEPIVVDEEYAMINPVWVINHAEVIDAPNVTVVPREEPKKTENEKKLIKTVYLGSFQSTKQHDPWHKGGSEYYVEAAAPTHKLQDGEIKVINDNIFRTRISFTRKEIRRDTTREFGYGLPMVTDWQEELNQIAFFVFENDASLFGSSVDIELSATWKGETYGLKVKLPFGSGDDDIAMVTYKRDYLFSTNNYEKKTWNKYTSDGVYWTLPFKIGEVIY